MAKKNTHQRVEKPADENSQGPFRREPWKTDGFAGRLRVAMGLRRAAEVARSVGIPQQTVDNYLRGARTSADRALALADELGVNVRWLISGEGPQSVITTSDNDWLVLYRFDLSQFEVGVVPPPVEKMTFRRDWVTRAVRTTRKLWIAALLSDAMPEVGREGDLVLCQDVGPELTDGHVYVFLLDGRPIVRRVQVRPEGLVLKAGPDTDPITIPADSQESLTPIGRVLAPILKPI